MPMLRYIANSCKYLSSIIVVAVNYRYSLHVSNSTVKYIYPLSLFLFHSGLYIYPTTIAPEAKSASLDL